MKADFHIEVETVMLPKHGQSCCGDVFEQRKVRDESRIIGVLSDGMGSGIKANIAANMTASMAVQFALNHESVERTADFIINTLPFDANRKITTASFSMIDINNRGEAKIVEYRNPPILWLTNGKQVQPETVNHRIGHPGGVQKITQSHIQLRKEDRLVLVSDGIVRSGMKSPHHPFGWEESLAQFVTDNVTANPNISARQLAQRILLRAQHNDGGQLCDDATCCVVYCRETRKLVIASGPPYHKHHDTYLADSMTTFPGKKVVCGGTTANIVARELNRPISVNLDMTDPTLPPTSTIEGIDLVTEGILTLGKTSLLIDSATALTTNGPAEQLARLMFESDEITFLIGTRINEAHHDPNLPVELEIRRNVIKKMAQTLEEKHLKTINIKYL